MMGADLAVLPGSRLASRVAAAENAQAAGRCAASLPATTLVLRRCPSCRHAAARALCAASAGFILFAM
jgi:hypothetical protein